MLNIRKINLKRKKIIVKCEAKMLRIHAYEIAKTQKHVNHLTTQNITKGIKSKTLKLN